MKKSYPTWAVPRTHTIGLDYRVVRARLGAQAATAKLTKEQLARRGKKRQRQWMKKTTPEQRSEWARLAGIEGARKRWGYEEAA